MGQLAKLRDIAPKLIALSNLDPAAITARIEIVESQIADLETIVQKDQSTVAELMERIRELEEGKSAVGDLEVVVRQLQSQFNKIPDSVFEG
jgi:predicted  nucleic acid-binding Zn-ribbon protein